MIAYRPSGTRRPRASVSVPGDVTEARSPTASGRSRRQAWSWTVQRMAPPFAASHRRVESRTPSPLGEITWSVAGGRGQRSGERCRCGRRSGRPGPRRGPRRRGTERPAAGRADELEQVSPVREADLPATLPVPRPTPGRRGAGADRRLPIRLPFGWKTRRTSEPMRVEFVQRSRMPSSRPVAVRRERPGRELGGDVPRAVAAPLATEVEAADPRADAGAVGRP